MEKNLKKLSRIELLQLLVKASEINETLIHENEGLRSEIAASAQQVEALKAQPPRAAEQSPKLAQAAKVGSIAEAALQANGYFDAAQRAADDYLREIKRLRDQMSARAQAQREAQAQQPWPAQDGRAPVMQVQQVRAQQDPSAYPAQQAAPAVPGAVQDAEKQASIIVSQANAQAQGMIAEARTKADAIVAEAEGRAREIMSEANRRADVLLNAATRSAAAAGVDVQAASAAPRLSASAPAGAVMLDSLALQGGAPASAPADAAPAPYVAPADDAEHEFPATLGGVPIGAIEPAPVPVPEPAPEPVPQPASQTQLSGAVAAVPPGSVIGGAASAADPAPATQVPTTDDPFSTGALRRRARHVKTPDGE